MDKFEIRAVIKYLVIKKYSTTQIHQDMVETLKDDAPSFTTVHKWATEFRQGRTSLEDDPRSGRPKSSSTSEIVQKVHEMVLQDRRLKVSDIATSMDISTERVHFILHKELDMKKLTARWVPRLLTVEQKQVRMNLSRECLARFQKNKTDFMRKFVTTDETWIHYHTPESKIQSKQWKHRNSPPPKKAMTVKSAGKVMASIFWDAKGILLIDYLQKGKTVNGEYYVKLLDKLDTIIKEKRPGSHKKKIIFHQDNARPHTALITMAKINELKYELLQHPPYSPDLAPSDFHLFPKLKIFLGGKRFSTEEEVHEAVNQYFGSLDENHFREGIMTLEHRWQKCIDLKGDYVEK